jgi:hypothetical protein
MNYDAPSVTFWTMRFVEYASVPQQPQLNILIKGIIALEQLW